MVTGEIMPVTKGPGAKLIGATINKNGTLRATATAVGLDTALAQIVKLVQEAQNSPTARRIAAGIFEPWAWCCELRSLRCQMSGSSVLVALNALTLKRLKLSRTKPDTPEQQKSRT